MRLGPRKIQAISDSSWAPALRSGGGGVGQNMAAGQPWLSSLQVDSLEIECLVDEHLEAAHRGGEHCLFVLGVLAVRPEDDLDHLAEHLRQDFLLDWGVHDPGSPC